MDIIRIELRVTSQVVITVALLVISRLGVADVGLGSSTGELLDVLVVSAPDDD